MLNWKNVKRLVIPEGVVHKITRNGVVLWVKFVSLGRVILSLGYRAVVSMTRGRAQKANVNLQERLTERPEFDALQPPAKRGRAWSWTRSRAQAVCYAATKQGVRWTEGLWNLAKLVPKQPDAQIGRSSTRLCSRAIAEHDTASKSRTRLVYAMVSRVRIMTLIIAKCVVAAKQGLVARNRLAEGNESKLARRLAIALKTRVMSGKASAKKCAMALKTGLRSGARGADGQASLQKAGLLIPLKILVMSGKAAAVKSSVLLESGLRCAVSFPGRIAAYCGQRVASALLLRQRIQAAGSPGRVRQKMAVRERVLSAVGGIARAVQRTPMRLMIRIRATAGQAVKTGLREHMSIRSKTALRFGGLPILGKFLSASGSRARASRGKIAVSGVRSGLVELLFGSVVTGKMPEVLRARPSLRRHQYLARVSTERTVKNTGRGAMPVQVFAGKLQNAAKAAMRGTKIPVQIAMRVPQNAEKAVMCGTKIPVQIAMRVPHLQDGSIRQSTQRISSRIHGLLTTERSAAGKTDARTCSRACGSMPVKTGPGAQSMQRSACFAAATIEIMTSPKDWEYPVQTGNCLRITQAYSVRQTDKKLMIK